MRRVSCSGIGAAHAGLDCAGCFVVRNGDGLFVVIITLERGVKAVQHTVFIIKKSTRQVLASRGLSLAVGRIHPLCLRSGSCD